MTSWGTIFLGVIAVATLATAVVQIGVLIAASVLAKRLTRLVDQIERELGPLIESLNAMGKDAARAASIATAQVDRVDRLFGDAAVRLDQTLGAIQSAVAVPVREGVAVMSGIRAALESIRRSSNSRPSRSRPGDDEDALFI